MDYLEAIKIQNKIATNSLLSLLDKNTQLNEKIVLQQLQRCLYIKFEIEETEELSFRKLAIMSIKTKDLKNRGLSDDVIAKKIHQYDCHQTNLISQKKILFCSYVERILGIEVSDDDVVNTQSLDKYASLIFRELVKK